MINENREKTRYNIAGGSRKKQGVEAVKKILVNSPEHLEFLSSHKKKDDLAGYFELIIHKDKKEVEIAYLGLLEEYHNQKLGSFLLSSAIRNSFKEKTNRVWVHTCSLDHKK